MMIICDFSFRRRAGKCILLSNFLGFCLLPFPSAGDRWFSGKSGFCFRIRHGCFFYWYRQAHGDKITLSCMVVGNEVFFLDFRSYNQF